MEAYARVVSEAADFESVVLRVQVFAWYSS